MATTIDADYRNSLVGTLLYTGPDGVVLVECDDPWVHKAVPTIVDNIEDAMFLIDRTVCVHDRIIRPLE